jgi:hypothetical protein
MLVANFRVMAREKTMAVVGKFSLDGFSGKIVMRNFGTTRAIEITFDLGQSEVAAKELLSRVIFLGDPGVTEVFRLQTLEAQYVKVAGDLGMDMPGSADMTVARAMTALDRLRAKAIPELVILGELESYNGV